MPLRRHFCNAAGQQDVTFGIVRILSCIMPTSLIPQSRSRICANIAYLIVLMKCRQFMPTSATNVNRFSRCKRSIVFSHHFLLDPAMSSRYNRLWLWTTLALIASQYEGASTRVQHYLREVKEQVSYIFGATASAQDNLGHVAKVICHSRKPCMSVED